MYPRLSISYREEREREINIHIYIYMNIRISIYMGEQGSGAPGGTQSLHFVEPGGPGAKNGPQAKKKLKIL